VLSRRVAWSVALVATLTMAVSYVDRQAFSFLSVKVTEDLDISNAEYGWLLLAFSLAYLVGTPLGGWWIDRVGARRGLVVSVLAWSVVAALHCFANGLFMLFALRIALGIAEGPSFPGSAQTVYRALPPAERSRGFGVLFTGSSVGGMVVPPLAAALYAFYGWRLAFVLTAVAGLVWLPLWLAATRQRGVRAALDEAPGTGADGPRATFGELVRHPITIRALVAIFAAAPIFGFAHGWGSKYLHHAFGVSQTGAGGYLWLPPLAFDLGAILFGDLAARQHRAEGAPPRLLVAISVPFAACLGFLPLASTPWEGTALIALAMLGGGGMYTLVTADMLSRMPAASVSFAGGILAGAQSLALIIMNPLVGEAVDRYRSYDVPTLALGLWALPGALIWLAWRPAPRFSAQRLPVASIIATSAGDSSKS
jgi:ACS family hexuronate transporter-like MFS transporter